MEKRWIEIDLSVPAAGIDLVCNELAELGCVGITVEERPLDTFTLPDPDEMSARDYPLKAYFPPETNREELQRTIAERLSWLARFVPGLVPRPPEVRTIQGQDWAENWKQHFKAERVGPRLVIKPTWEELDPRPDDVIVNLDPGMAFGTGTHGTTRLCLEALARLFEGSSHPGRVLDVGTGSGILALAAAALGARRVLACDIEPESCRIAEENARLNRLGDRIEVTGRDLTELEGEFDVVMANILAEENVRLADELLGRLAQGGTLILSGILREKEALVADGFAGFDLEGPDISYREDWCCLLYRRRD